MSLKTVWILVGIVAVFLVGFVVSWWVASFFMAAGGTGLVVDAIKNRVKAKEELKNLESKRKAKEASIDKKAAKEEAKIDASKKAALKKVEKDYEKDSALPGDESDSDRNDRLDRLAKDFTSDKNNGM
ncbi:MAG: hypothetical protein KKB59_20170 [Spirochaetes bacterium]|nr:hypothetical protein [Spirochaetota bacterium]